MLEATVLQVLQPPPVDSPLQTPPSRNRKLECTPAPRKHQRFTNQRRILPDKEGTLFDAVQEEYTPTSPAYTPTLTSYSPPTPTCTPTGYPTSPFVFS